MHSMQKKTIGKRNIIVLFFLFSSSYDIFLSVSSRPPFLRSFALGFFLFILFWPFYFSSFSLLRLVAVVVVVRCCPCYTTSRILLSLFLFLRFSRSFEHTHIHLHRRQRPLRSLLFCLFSICLMFREERREERER